MGKFVQITEDFFKTVGLPAVSSELAAALEEKETALVQLAFPAAPQEGTPEEKLNELFRRADDASLTFTNLYEKAYSAGASGMLVMEEFEKVGAVVAVEFLEDYLDEHGLAFPDEERDSSGDDGAAIIYGERYDLLLNHTAEALLFRIVSELDCLRYDSINANECDTMEEKQEAFDALVSMYHLK